MIQLKEIIEILSLNHFVIAMQFLSNTNFPIKL